MQKNISQARVEASRRNGALSKGPKTSEGKARSSQNALKHGLRSEKTPLIPNEISQDTTLPGEHQEFQETLAALTSDFAPATLLETRLVERLAQLDHRLRRALRIETALLDRASVEALDWAARFPDDQPKDDPKRTRDNWLLSRAFTRESEELTLLSYYESRLSRDFHRTLAQLRQSQRLRKSAESESTLQPDPCLASDGQVALAEPAGSRRQGSATPDLLAADESASPTVPTPPPATQKSSQTNPTPSQIVQTASREPAEPGHQSSTQGDMMAS